MSLVGPRPLPIGEGPQDEEIRKKRLEANPGITGLWQITARDEPDFDHWANLDILYIEKQSLLLDIIILLKTIPAVLSGRGGMVNGAARLLRLGHWRGGISSLADQFVVSLTNFTTGIIVARACNQAVFGQYMLGFSLVLFVQGLQNSIVSVPYTFFSARFTGTELEQYTASATFQQLTLSLLAACTLLIAGFAFPSLLVQLGIGNLVLAVAAALSLILFKEHIRRICFSRLKIRDALLVDIAACILQISSLYIMMSYGSLTVSHAFLIIGGSCLPPRHWLGC